MDGAGIPRSIFRPDTLSGRVALVSGAGSGLGRSIAYELARMGATVVGCGRRRALVDETSDYIRGFGGTAAGLQLDIRDESAVESAIAHVLDRHGRLDVLVNNAGGQFFGPAELTTAKGLRTVLELNTVGMWNLTLAAATAAFLPQGEGRVINITVSPHNGIQGFMASAASRAAVENMTRSLSSEWGRRGVTLVAVAAGAFLTDVITTKYPAEMTDKWADTNSVGRVGAPEEIASLVGYLASPIARYLTGCVVTIDGGVDNGPPKEILAETR